IYPIIRSNYSYIDDIGRVYQGYDDWGYFSRYISNFLSHILHGDKYLSDISPLPQLLSIFVLVIASLIVIKAVKGSSTISLWELIAVLPLGLSPYFLECLSYKYDSIYMSLSILAAVFPLLFQKKNKVVYFIINFLCVLVMCMTYQASSGIFPMLVVLIAFLSWCNKEKTKEIVSFILLSAVSYCSSILFFMLVLMNPVTNYVSNKIAAFSTVLLHYKAYIKLLCSDFKLKWLILILLLFICFLSFSVWRSKQRKLLTLLLAFSTAICMLLLSFGLYPFLQTPLDAPRTMYGVGACIVCLGLGICIPSDTNECWIPRILICMLSWFFITFALTYGNALRVQDEYVDFRMMEVIDDLTDIPDFSTKEEKIVQLSGNVGYAPVIENMPKDYNILRRLVPVTFGENWHWAGYKFYHYYNMKHIVWNPDETMELTSDWNALQESMYHTIYQQANRFIVQLK
ncbi:MAG: glucosyltransferase domain-containing protein, partial [bacterium]|nr:glucosyltransferase domain-containing protein [bacterium]